MNDIAIYQHPFVDVFQFTKLFDWKQTTKEGQVTDQYDKQVAKKVIQIAGTTSASNYIQVPATKLLPKQSLGLIGKYIYIVIKCEQSKNFVIHFDYVINDNRVVKLSVSNMYKEPKNMDGRSLQIPLVAVPPKKWTVVCIDASSILTENKVFDSLSTPKFSMRSFQVCATLQIKGVYTSDIRYAANTLPKGMALKVTGKDKNWFSEYAWISLPGGEAEKPDPEAQENVQINGQKALPSKGTTKSNLKKPMPKSLKHSDSKLVQFKSPGSQPEETKNQDIAQLVQQDEPEMSLKEEMELFKQRAAKEAEERFKLQQETSKENLEKTQQEIDEIREEFDCNLKSKNIVSDVEVTLYHENALYDANKSHKSNSEDFVMKPNPILALDRVVGSHPRYRANQIFFNKDAKMAHELLYCQANLLLGYHAKLQKQRQFMDSSLNLSNLDRLLVVQGYAITFSKQPSNTKTVQQDKQQKEDVQVTIWDSDDTDKSIFSFRPPIQELKSASISPDKKNLALSAKDFQGRELILVYAFQEMVHHGRVELLGRQLSDFDLTSLRFNDALSQSLIGCGKENIRFFKIKNNFLPSQLVALNNTSRGKVFNNSLVTTRMIEQSGNRMGGKKPVNVHVSTECGLVYIINFYSRQVDKIVQVNEGPVQALLHFDGSQESNGGFFMTCSREQGVLRLWNHDFSKLASEVSLNQTIASCDINVDGNEIAVLAQNGTISLLELESSAFSVLMRSHADEVQGIALNDITGSLISIGKDSSIKVWHAETMEQIHEFNTSEHDPPTIVAASHVDELAAVGFKSGFVRIFSMSERKMVHETMIFQSQTMDIQFDNSSKFMAAFFKNGKIVVFNLEREFQPVKNIDYEFPNAHYFSLSFSTDGSLLANISSNANTVTVWETNNFSLKWYIDLTGEVISKIQFAPNGKDLLIMTTSSKLKYIRIDPLLGPTDDLETVRDQYGLADKECADFFVTPNNKYIIVAGKDGLIRVYDYFMRGKILPQQQVFRGHSVFPSCLAFQSDMRFIYSVGPNNGIFKWGFFGDKSLPQDTPLNEFYEKTQREHERITQAAEQSEITLPTWDKQELMTYTEEQLAQVREQIVNKKDSSGQQNHATITGLQTNRPNTDLLQDGGLSLRRGPKVDSLPAGYSYEQYDIQLSKMLACSTIPKAGNNFVWIENEHYFAYSVQNILVFEELDQERTQLLKRETNDIIHEIKMSPNGRLLLAFTKRGPLDGFPQILVFDAKTKKKVNQISIDDVELMSVEFSKNSNMLLAISYNGAQSGSSHARSTLYLYDFLDGRRDVFCKSIVPFRIHAAQWNFHAEYDGDEFVTLSDHDYYYWRITEALQMQYQPGKCPQQETKTRLTCLSFVEPMLEQNSVYLLIGTSDGNVWIVDTRVNSFIYQAKILECSVHRLYSTVARICAEGTEDTKVHFWELVKKLGDFVYDASDPNYFFSGGEDTLTLDGYPSASYYDKSATQGIFLSTNGSFWLLNFLEKGTVKLKQAHTPNHPLTKAVAFKYVTPNQFHPSPQDSLNGDSKEDLYAFDQNYVIATSGADGAVKTWNMFDQEHLCNFTIPKEQCTAIAAHQFKPIIISSFTDGYLRFFDMQASRNIGRCLLRSAEEDQDSTDYATHLKILPSGVHILGATKNGQVFLIFVQSWEPLGITLHNLVSLNQAIHTFEVSFLEPYNKWVIGTCNGKAIVYNRQDANAFKQELFDARQPPKFSYMDCFNAQEYVDNGFTETRKVNQLDHYYSMAKRNLVHNEVSVENEVEVAFLNNDLGSHISFVRKSQNLFIRNFELHQVVKRIEFPTLLKQLEMAPGSTPFVYVTTEDNKLNMVDFVNDANRTIVDLIHDEVCAMKVCPNGRYVLTGGDKGDIVMWKVRRTNDQNGNIVMQ